MVGISHGSGSLLKRRDRQGTTITRGSKQHRVTFRDEIPGEEDGLKGNKALFATNSSSRPSSVPLDLRASRQRREMIIDESPILIQQEESKRNN